MTVQDFDNLYESLNVAQRMAVDAIEGPVMVIAGPGTGKTQILAARILNILKKTDARPEEILCLTYTESGAYNMKTRLASFMGQDAYKVNIHTFHGLCNKIIRDFPDTFSHRELRLIEEIEKIDILNQLIHELPKDSPIKSYSDDPGPLRRQLSMCFNLLQDEGYTTEQLREWVSFLSKEENFSIAFPDRVYKKDYGGFKSGDIKRSKYDELIQGWEKLLAASQEYEKYKAKKASLGVFEFSDMIEWVAAALDKNEELLLACQEQYQYVLVDEYQDTSGLQNHILLQLISFWEENPNCFVVGDDDQSIYAFQGARVDNMLSFADKYKSNLNTIVLTSNYRSTKNVLDAADSLIRNNQNRLVNRIEGLSKNLTADGPWGTLDQPVIFSNFSNRFHEAVWIADELGRKVKEGARYEDCAVIYPKHKLADDLVDVLRSRGIPFVLAKDVDVLQEPLVRELLNWLKYLAEELEFPNKGEYLLYEILHSPLYDIKPFDIATLSSDIYNKSKKEKQIHWREYIAGQIKTPAQGNLFENGIVTPLKMLWDQTEGWLKEAAMLNVPQMIEHIYSNGGFLSYALRHADRDWCLEVLTSFLRFAQSRNDRSPFMSLKQFLTETETMMNNGIVLPLEKQIGAESGVVLTTAHRSKGLEFDHVYIISADQESWEKDRSSGLPFKVSYLIQGMDKRRRNEQDAQENYEEKRRLFYVALTRARKTLTVTWSNQKIDAKGTQLIPSQFVVEINGGMQSPQITLPREELTGLTEKILSVTGTPMLSGYGEPWLKKQLESFKFSPTTLYTLFECGIKFYYSRLVRVPSAPNASAGYGSALHDTLARWVQTGTDKDNPKWLNSRELVELFEAELYSQRSKFSESIYRIKLQQGRDILPDYHKARIGQFSQEKVVITETWFQSVIEGTEIGGFADKLIFHGNNVVIVDYKSGNPTYAEKKFKAPSEKDLASGKLPPQYWFQVGIYHLIIGNITGKNWTPVLGMLDLLDKNEAGEFQQLKMTYSQEDLDLLRNYIREGRKKLETLDFLKGCNQCEWCEFAKQTGQVIHIPAGEIPDPMD